jgi:hypothetical protein
VNRSPGIGTSISSTEDELVLPIVRDLLEMDSGISYTVYGMTMSPLPGLLELGSDICYTLNVKVTPS